jgi:hypothetical protein
MERSGLGRGARTLLEEFARIKVTDVILPTTTTFVGGTVTALPQTTSSVGSAARPPTAGREVRLSCVTEPDDAQRALIDRLGLTLPKRLSRPSWARPPSKLDGSCSLDFSPGSPHIGEGRRSDP